MFLSELRPVTIRQPKALTIGRMKDLVLHRKLPILAAFSLAACGTTSGGSQAPSGAYEAPELPGAGQAPYASIAYAEAAAEGGVPAPVQGLPTDYDEEVTIDMLDDLKVDGTRRYAQAMQVANDGQEAPSAAPARLSAASSPPSAPPPPRGGDDGFDGVTISVLPAAAAAPAPAPRGPQYGVHLASYKTETSLRTGWTVLSQDHGDLLAGVSPFATSVDVPGKGRFTRLLAGPIESATRAKDLCASLQRRDVYCAVLPLDGDPF